MAETRNLVVLGASFGGLSAAHYIAKHILPQLVRAEGYRYELHIVDPSTHFWWHIAAPREIVNTKELTHSKCFVPIEKGFHQYSNLKDSIHFHHASAVGLDLKTKTVQLKTHQGAEETLPYHALVIATGVRSATPLTTLQGDHTISEKALEEMHAKLANAKDIVIGGGGPVGVEIAGEIATHLKGKGAKITLVTGSSKLLPVLSEARAIKAQKMLEKVGVSVLYKTKVTGSEQSADGKTSVVLDNGQSLQADVYIPAVGMTANTEFLPAELKTDRGYVQTNGATLRVDGAGPLVYSVGDVSGVDTGGVMNLYNTVPVVGANMAHDLLGEAKVGTLAEKAYKRKDVETQMVPIGPSGGVGAFNGFGLPGFMISMVKGKDYMISNMPQFTEGTKWVKA